jgi:hypothetical protein
MSKKYIIALICLVVGYIIGDYDAFHFARHHNVPKTSGLFRFKPKSTEA